MQPSGLGDIVEDDEGLARYLTSSSYFGAGLVKPAAFMPDREAETSVFRHGREPRDELWRIGYLTANQRTLHGAAIIRARHVRLASLDIRAKEPPPRHADIVGWPFELDADLQKAQRKQKALLLAQHAELVRR